MWHRQSPVRVLVWLLKILSYAAAAAGTAAGIYFLIAEKSGIAAAAVSYALAAAGITAAVVAVWRRDNWCMNGALGRKCGVLLRSEYTLRKERLTTLEVERPLFLSIFKAVRINACTSADGERRGGSKPLVVKRDIGRKLARKLMPIEKGYVREYSAGSRQVFLMAVSRADFFSGLLLAVPAIVWSAENIDRRLSQRLYHALENTGQLLLPRTAPWLSALALIPVAGWCFHLLYTFFAYGKFRYVRSGGTIMVGHGVIGRKTVCFPISAVTATVRCQTLLSGLAKLETSRAVIPGYGECVMLPAVNEREMMLETSALFPHGEPGVCIRCTKNEYWWRWWAAGAAAVLVVTLRAALTAQFWRPAVLLCGLPAALLLFWKCTMAAQAGRKAAIRLFSDSVEIVGLTGLTVCRLRVLRGSIAETGITQNIFQQCSGLCNMYIRPHGGKRRIYCRHLPLDRCISIIGRLG